VTDLAALERACGAVEAELGPISILVHSPGIAGSNAVLEAYDPEEWRRFVEINLVGTHHASRSSSPA
jgi:NAD(P)-dependent dehydrogenase (short-subunit alcohol dehydrogenase family)